VPSALAASIENQNDAVGSIVRTDPDVPASQREELSFESPVSGSARVANSELMFVAFITERREWLIMAT
jgi:hypothetical protein